MLQSPVLSDQTEGDKRLRTAGSGRKAGLRVSLKSSEKQGRRKERRSLVVSQLAWGSWSPDHAVQCPLLVGKTDILFGEKDKINLLCCFHLYLRQTFMFNLV